jgi:hypothetical protein
MIPQGRSWRRCPTISGWRKNCGRHVKRLGSAMRINPRGRRRPYRRQASKGQRMPGNRELKATNVREQALSITRIKLNQRNSRIHSAKQIRQIANSIVAFGSTGLGGAHEN